jgi:hypothetical protein
VRSLCVIVLFFLASSGTHAADIEVRYLESGLTQVTIEGDLEFEDVAAFQAKTASLPSTKVTVEFRSKGGSLLAGIRIGSLIRAKKFPTVVPDGAQCASACALAWLGGIGRYVGEHSRVGFHAAYVNKASGPVESGSGNAILGAYLNQLGLSEKAILYITHAVPTSMQWLRMEEAAEYGIAVAPLSSHSVPMSNATDAATTEDPDGSPEQRVIDFVLALLQRWSGPNSEILSSLDGLYADNVLYYGKSTSRQGVLLRKRRFADRWTQRAYQIQPGSLSASCSGAGKPCRVRGVLSWKFFDPKTANTSHGLGSFEYKIALEGNAPQIAAETSTVGEPPSAVSNSLTQVGRSLQRLVAKLSNPAIRTAIRPKAPIAR